MALGDIDLAFAWQAWHLWHWAGSWSALVPGDAAVFCVAGVALGDLPKAFGVAALGDIDLAFAWQAWHLLHWAGSCDALGPRWSPVTPPSLSHSVFTFFW